jgi:glycosylphosphatidylinositol transamidase (GPIT) subunit GPI8
MATVSGASAALLCWLVLLPAFFAEVGAASMWTKHTNNWAVLVCTSRYWYVLQLDSQQTSSKMFC